jgi:soluble lytic murein transglycosylase-like protein
LKKTICFLFLFVLVSFLAAFAFGYKKEIKVPETIYEIEEPIEIIPVIEVDEDFEFLKTKTGNYELIYDSIKNYNKGFKIRELYALIEAESDFTEKAVSSLGKNAGVGLCQVSNIVLKEFNLKTNHDYSQEDLFDASKNLQVAIWYLDRLRAHYKIPDNIINLYCAYNIGPSKYSSYYKDYYRNGVTEKGKKYNSLKRFREKLENNSKKS